MSVHEARNRLHLPAHETGLTHLANPAPVEALPP
jgi:hypothetical protein